MQKVAECTQSEGNLTKVHDLPQGKNIVQCLLGICTLVRLSHMLGNSELKINIISTARLLKNNLYQYRLSNKIILTFVHNSQTYVVCNLSYEAT